LGWKEVGPWKWKHEEIGEEFDFDVLEVQKDKGKIAHAIRESWRSERWKEFLKPPTASKKARNDSKALQGVSYDPKRVGIVRKAAYEDPSLAYFYVGAWQSPIPSKIRDAQIEDRRKSVQEDADKYKCVWGCGCREADTRHTLWTCPQRSVMLAEPADKLTARLGWPGCKETPDKELKELVKTIVEKTWEGIHGKREAKEVDLGWSTKNHLFNVQEQTGEEQATDEGSSSEAESRTDEDPDTEEAKEDEEEQTQKKRKAEGEEQQKETAKKRRKEQEEQGKAAERGETTRHAEEARREAQRKRHAEKERQEAAKATTKAQEEQEKATTERRKAREAEEARRNANGKRLAVKERQEKEKRSKEAKQRSEGAVKTSKKNEEARKRPSEEKDEEERARKRRKKPG
jgi:hypothetical protein